MRWMGTGGIIDMTSNALLLPALIVHAIGQSILMERINSDIAVTPEDRYVAWLGVAIAPIALILKLSVVYTEPRPIQHQPK